MSNNEPEWTEGRIVTLLGHAVVPLSPIVFFMMGFLSINDHVIGQYDVKFVDYIVPGQVSDLTAVTGLIFGICGLIVGIWASKERCPVAVAEGFGTAGLILAMFLQLFTAVGP